MFNYILLLTGILIAVSGQLLLKTGVEAKGLSLSPKIIIDILTNKYLFSGFLLYGIGALLWLFILKRFPLSIAYPALSLSYVIVVLASAFFFKEPITANKIIGMICIFLGITFLFRQV